MTRDRRGGRARHSARARSSDRGRDREAVQEVGVLSIDAIAAGGDGVGRLHGMAVFVPRTAPGDQVQAAITMRGRFGKGRVLQLLTPSAHRVAAACPHYEHDGCGGCQLQHLDEATQQVARRRIVQETLQRIGRRTIPLPMLQSEQAWGYRGRLTLTLVRRRREWIGGLHPHDDPARVFPLDVCPISHPLLVTTWHAVRSLLVNGPAFVDASTVRLGLRLIGEDAVAVVVEGGGSWPTSEAWGAALHAFAPSVRQVWWHVEGRVPQLVAGDDGAEPNVLVTEDVSASDPSASPDAQEALAFAQVNRGIAASLQAMVLDAVQPFHPMHVVDAYAGGGGLTVRLAEQGCRVTAIESDAAGVAVARQRLAAAGHETRATVVRARVEEALASLAAAPDVLVVNPPRRGVDAAVCSWLESASAASVRGVVYVSCDPATLARDLARLPSWHVRSVACFDMFPQTAHVETVCVLDRDLLSSTATAAPVPTTA